MKAHILPDDRIIGLKPGKTLLKSAHAARVPLSHACGGVGSCSTCRVWVIEGEDNLPARDAAEAETAKRLGLEDRVRLACRLVPMGDLKVRRLTLEDQDVKIKTRSKEKPGEELELVVMFTDLRNFTPFAESLPPHDVIFILDRFFSQMGKIITAYGGIIQNYMGDGFLALFGQDNDPLAAEKSIKAALEMHKAMEDFTVFLEANFNKSIKMGIGLHWGKVVLGTMGFGSSRRLTVIGDTVNTASRIESTTKDAKVDILISQTLLEQIDVSVETGKTFLAELKGKSEKLVLHQVLGLSGTEQPTLETIRDEQNNLFYKACRQGDVNPGVPYPIEINGEKRLLVLAQGEAYAIEDRCPHMRLPLQGAKVTADCGIQCPWHHSAFDLRTGEVKAWAPWPPVVGPILAAVRQKRLLCTWPVLVSKGYYWVSDKPIDDLA
jgi:class 3 adenylate cyclase/nitrite reductase/ring-hydroxylating ferredoxin subunit